MTEKERILALILKSSRPRPVPYFDKPIEQRTEEDHKQFKSDEIATDFMYEGA